jgi:hypothetical protein
VIAGFNKAQERFKRPQAFAHRVNKDWVYGYADALYAMKETAPLSDWAEGALIALNIRDAQDADVDMGAPTEVPAPPASEPVTIAPAPILSAVLAPAPIVPVVPAPTPIAPAVLAPALMTSALPVPSPISSAEPAPATLALAPQVSSAFAPVAAPSTMSATAMENSALASISARMATPTPALTGRTSEPPSREFHAMWPGVNDNVGQRAASVSAFGGAFAAITPEPARKDDPKGDKATITAKPVQSSDADARISLPPVDVLPMTASTSESTGGEDGLINDDTEDDLITTRLLADKELAKNRSTLALVTKSLGKRTTPYAGGNIPVENGVKILKRLRLARSRSTNSEMKTILDDCIEMLTLAVQHATVVG